MSLSQMDFDEYCQQHNLSPAAKEVITQVRSSPPSRTPQGRAGNVTVRYPSRKMGATIWAESHRVEFAGIIEYEFDPGVLEFYDQPSPIPLHYESANGRSVTAQHTPDFFVLDESGAGWDEWKTEERLIELSKSQPNRYKKIDGRWRCPPGEAFAAQYGLRYRIRSSAEINWALHENSTFFSDFLRPDAPPVSTEVEEQILHLIKEYPGITLAELLRELSAPATSDDIYKLIAENKIFLDLRTARVSDRTHAHLFQDRATAKAFAHLLTATPSDFINTRDFPIEVGSLIDWDGIKWEIINVAENSLSLLSLERKNLIELNITSLTQLLTNGKIRGIQSPAAPLQHEQAREIFVGANEAAHQTALKRLRVVQDYLTKRRTSVSSTERGWIRQYTMAEEKYGQGYLGLLPAVYKRGNRTPRLDSEIKKHLQQYIDANYFVKKRPRRAVIYEMYKADCAQKQMQPVSRVTFDLYIKSSRPRKEQVEAREGPRAARQVEEWYWELEQTTPRHGTRPWEIVHIDHTQLDLELVHSETYKNIGRPWLTLLIDAHTRRILSFFLTFEEPSYISCMMVLRRCVERHGRLPSTLVIDNAKEFHSFSFERFAAQYEITLKYRPWAHPRYGNVCERIFGTTNLSFIHNLVGNTQMMTRVRQVTKSVNPKNNAVWSLPEFYPYVTIWCHEIYDQAQHSSLGESPAEAYTRTSTLTGLRNHRAVPYDDVFLSSTLPAVVGRTRIVNQVSGIQVDNIQYWNPVFGDNTLHRKSVEVNEDRDDIGHVFALVRGTWVECLSNHHALLKGHSKKELSLVTTEQKAKLSEEGRAQRKTDSLARAKFLNEVVQKERQLQQQKQNELQKALTGSISEEVKADAPLTGEPVSSTNDQTTNASELPILDVYVLNLGKGQ